jgi:hypothetical protein
MPEPISSSRNSSVYAPSPCDPTRASCVEPAPEPITIPEVVIEGRLPRTPPTCEQQRNVAAVGCAFGVTALALAVAEKGVTPQVLLASAKEAMSCTKLVLEYESCKREGALRTLVANHCIAAGGTPVAGVEKNEIECLP